MAASQVVATDSPAVAEPAEQQPRPQRSRGGQRSRPPRRDQAPPAQATERPPQPQQQAARRDRPPQQRNPKPVPHEAPRPVTMEDIAMDPKITPLPMRAARPPVETDADDHGVVGFGDHMPAFLARSPRIARG